MKKIKIFFFFFILALKLSFSNELYNEIKNLGKFNKIILWGHKLHTHTHSYIHWGFFRAFKHLGYEVLWLDNNDKIEQINFSNSLFITEGQVDQKIPLREDCFYILHHPQSNKYEALLNNKKAIKLIAVYLKECLSNNKLEKVNDYIFYDIENKTIHIPWATDLLPHEIDKNKEIIKSKKKEQIVNFIGSFGGGLFGNINQIEPFKKACNQNNIKFHVYVNKTMEQNIELIQNSIMAPALQGAWQLEFGYIPCRIFKNISYGQFGITNSKYVYNLFNQKIIYNHDTYQLFYDTQAKLKNLNLNELYELMDLVRDKHTYLNRIFYIFKFINLIKK